MICRLLFAGVVSATLLGAAPGSAQESLLPTIAPAFTPPAVTPNPCGQFSCFNGADFDGHTLAAVGAGYSGVFIFVSDGLAAWSLQAVLPNPDPSGGSTPTFDPAFGRAMALKGHEVLVAGGHHDAAAGTFQPELFVFERRGSEWTHRQTLVLQGQPDAIALDHSTVLISTSSQPPGAVSVFRKRNDGDYHLESTLSPQDGLGAGFGSPLAIDGGTALIGANDAVHVFERHRDRWTPVQRLTPDADVAGAGFGAALAIDRDQIAIGAPFAAGANPGRPGSIQMYVRRGREWQRTQVIDNPIPPDSELRDFGSAIDLAGGRLLAGGHTSNPFAVFVPMAYLFERHDGVWSATASLGGYEPRMVRISGDGALVDTAGIRGGSFPAIFDLPTRMFPSRSRERRAPEEEDATSD